MNNVTMTGRLTQDPERRHAGETEIVQLRLAVPRRKGRDGEDRGAVYIDVVCFDGLARVCGEYLAKGRHAAVVGRLELDEWEQDGQRRQRHKVVADQVEFLDRAPSREPDGSGAIDEVAARRRDQSEAQAA